MRSKGKTAKADILIATPEMAYGATVANFLARQGFTVERCHDAAGVLRLAGRRTFDVLVLDLDLGNEGRDEANVNE